jgi:hypothetical protein
VNVELSLAAAFVVGMLGSVHCIGMCGGIVGTLGSTLPRRRATVLGRLPWWLGYNAGRIASYAIAGAVAGLLGNATLEVFSADRVREVGSLLSGAFMIVLGLYLAGWWQGLRRLELAGASVWRRIEPLARGLFPVRTPWRALALGALWGWLPCGLVYATLAWSLASADALAGAALMAAFGLGTLPMLVTMGGAADVLMRARTRPSVRATAGIAVLVLGVLTFLGIVHPVHVAHPS